MRRRSLVSIAPLKQKLHPRLAPRLTPHPLGIPQRVLQEMMTSGRLDHQRKTVRRGHPRCCPSFPRRRSQDSRSELLGPHREPLPVVAARRCSTSKSQVFPFSKSATASFRFFFRDRPASDLGAFSEFGVEAARCPPGAPPRMPHGIPWRRTPLPAAFSSRTSPFPPPRNVGGDFLPSLLCPV